MRIQVGFPNDNGIPGDSFELLQLGSVSLGWTTALVIHFFSVDSFLGRQLTNYQKATRQFVMWAVYQLPLSIGHLATIIEHHEAPLKRGPVGNERPLSTTNQTMGHPPSVAINSPPIEHQLSTNEPSIYHQRIINELSIPHQ